MITFLMTILGIAGLYLVLKKMDNHHRKGLKKEKILSAFNNNKGHHPLINDRNDNYLGEPSDPKTLSSMLGDSDLITVDVDLIIKNFNGWGVDLQIHATHYFPDSDLFFGLDVNGEVREVFLPFNKNAMHPETGERIPGIKRYLRKHAHAIQVKKIDTRAINLIKEWEESARQNLRDILEGEKPSVVMVNATLRFLNFNESGMDFTITATHFDSEYSIFYGRIIGGELDNIFVEVDLHDNKKAVNPETEKPINGTATIGRYLQRYTVK